MRFFSTLICAIFVAFAAAQNYAINTPTGGFQVTAGQSITITWTPAQGTIAIYLTQGAVNTPGQGTLLASNVDGSSGTATLRIPSTIQASSTGQYNFGIAQGSNNNFVNFSAPFAVSGATIASASASASATASATASLSSLSASASSRASSVSSSLSSALSSVSSAASSAASSASSRMSSAMSSASSAASSAMSSASRTASSSAAAATTSAPSSNGAGMVQAGGFFAMVAGLVAVM